MTFLTDTRASAWDCDAPGFENIPCRQNPELRKNRNCMGEHDAAHLLFHEISECPIGWLKKNVDMVALWNLYVFCKQDLSKAGLRFLPKTGGPDDQGAFVMDAMQFMDSEAIRMQREKNGANE